MVRGWGRRFVDYGAEFRFRGLGFELLDSSLEVRKIGSQPPLSRSYDGFGFWVLGFGCRTVVSCIHILDGVAYLAAVSVVS